MNTHYEAVVRLSLLNSSGQTRDIDAVVDTGYNDFLTLPPVLVAELHEGQWYWGGDNASIGECKLWESDDEVLGEVRWVGHALNSEISYGP